ncbi:MAG: hypothetical protein M1817_006398 [Caeruleum heppii]|nr:MAG: hypothetical protein M1817_006398 [Caeruleum heppii]
MLLPSALPCDARTPTYRPARSTFFTPPPSSDEEQTAAPSQTNISLYNTCRALQSMLMPGSTTPPTRVPARKTATRSSLLSPVGLRPAPAQTSTPHRLRSRVKKTAPRGINKRRRSVADDGHVEVPNVIEKENQPQSGFSTPKRRRLAPADLPLGLDRSDFEALEPLQEIQPTASPAPEPSLQSPPASTTQEEDLWSHEEDQKLVELVLGKLRLEQGDWWNDCAKTLGKDKDSLGKRWKSLVGEGSVGLREKDGNGNGNENRKRNVKRGKGGRKRGRVDVAMFQQR